MRSRFARRVMVACVVLLAVGLFLDEATAQRRRGRRSRRITNPVVTSTTTTTTPAAVVSSTPSADPQIISTAKQQAAEAEAGVRRTTTPRRSTRRRASAEQAEEDEASVRRTVNDLSTQVTKLTEKLSQMEQQQRTLVDLERLTRAEQRAEALRTQLQTVQEKEAALAARMDQIDFDLKPENIERGVAAYGSTRPEDAREARRRGLENERTRTRAQLDLLQTSRQRLEAAIANADAEVERLRQRVDDAAEPRSAEATDNGDTDDTAPITPTTTTAEPTPNNPQR